MGQRPRQNAPAPTGERDYRYKGDVNANIRPHEQCEMEQDAHVAKPKTWPPVKIGNQLGEPYVEARCQDCGAWLQVYAGHATGALKGIRVVLPQAAPVEPEPELVGAGAPERRGPGRPRKYVA